MTASPDYSQAVADIIDGLGDSPTADEIYHATRAYDVNYLAAAAASEAKAAGGGGGGSQPVIPGYGSEGYAQADSPTACVSGETPVKVIKASPPSWLDTSGNILEPGVYAAGTYVTLNVAATSPGVYALIKGIANSDLLIPFDGLVGLNNAVSFDDVVGLADSDLPYGTQFGVKILDDDTASLNVVPWIQRLIYVPS